MLYDFKCRECGEEIEETMSLAEYEALEFFDDHIKLFNQPCSACGGEMTRKPYTPPFTLQVNEGDMAGWEFTDYQPIPRKTDR